MNCYYFFTTMFFAQNLFANEGGTHEAGIPKVVMYQAINVGALLLLVVIFILPKISQALIEKKRTYENALKKADELRKEAAQREHHLKEQLAKLERESQKIIDQAKADSESLKAGIIQEAKKQAKNLDEEAKRIIAEEIERAKRELQTELLERSMAAAKELIKSSAQASDQKRLQDEFVTKIKQVEG